MTFTPDSVLIYQNKQLFNGPELNSLCWQWLQPFLVRRPGLEPPRASSCKIACSTCLHGRLGRNAAEHRRAISSKSIETPISHVYQWFVMVPRRLFFLFSHRLPLADPSSLHNLILAFTVAALKAFKLVSSVNPVKPRQASSSFKPCLAPSSTRPRASRTSAKRHSLSHSL